MRFSFLQALFRSFYDRHFYNYVATQWRGLGFLYLFFLIFIVFLIVLIPFYGQVSANFARAEAIYAPHQSGFQSPPVKAEAVPRHQLPSRFGLLGLAHLLDPLWIDYLQGQVDFNKIPQMTFENQELSIDKPVPYKIELAIPKTILKELKKEGYDYETFTIIFNTKIREINIKDYPQAMLIFTRDRILIRQEQGKFSIRTYSDIEFEKDEIYTLGPTEIIAWLHGALRVTAFNILPVIFIILFIFMFVLKILQTIFYAAIARSLSKKDLSLELLARLVAVALTPAMLIFSFMLLFGVFFPFWLLFLIITEFLVIYLGIKSIEDPV